MDDSTLVAYADGQLDSETAGEVEAALTVDAEAQARLRVFQDSAGLVRAALGDIIAEPVPAWLTETANSLRTSSRRRRFVLPLAASLAAATIGLAGGYLIAADQLSRTDRMAHETTILTEMAEYYAVFASDPRRITELGAEHAAYLESWFGERLDRGFRIPDLSRHGLDFQGGRIMAIGTQPAVLLVYDTPDGKLVGICIIKYWETGDHATTATQKAGMNMVFWAQSGFSYALMGKSDETLLRALVDDTRRALDI